jgi:invasion protein IalB
MTGRRTLVAALLALLAAGPATASSGLLDQIATHAPHDDQRLVINPMTPQDNALLAMEQGQPMPGQPMPGQPMPGQPMQARPMPPGMARRPAPPPLRQYAQAKPKPRPPAPAPVPARPQGVDSWFVQCPPKATTGCEMVRRVLRPDGQQLLSLIIGPDQRQPGRLIGTVVMPLGMAVRESVPMLIDNRFIALLPVDTCLPVGCVMSLAMSQPMVNVLRSGGTFELLALATNGQTVPLQLPLGGFGEAIARVAAPPQ